jgi:hypothetical protein
MRGSPFRRTGPDRIDVRLPRPLLGAVAWAVDAVQHAASSPGTTGFKRLFAPIEAGISDDPLATLERQTIIGSVLESAAGSQDRTWLTDAEAEAWLQLLGLALALQMEELGIRTEADRNRLDRRVNARIDAMHALQICLIDALDSAAPS